MTTQFDTFILGLITQIHLPMLADRAIRVIVGLYTFKGYLLIPVLWWMFFQPGERREWRREMALATIASGLVALAVGRFLAHFLPFRLRPIYNPNLHLPFATEALRGAALSDWSSFPSDHAMLWMAVSLGIFLVWRGIGTIAMIYTAVVICLPRAYLGFHYPTDLLAGAAIGLVITFIMTRDAVRQRTAAPVLRWMLRYPAPASVVAFLISFELITQFDDLLRLMHSVIKAIR